MAVDGAASVTPDQIGQLVRQAIAELKKDLLEDTDLVHFLDNKGALASLIRRAAKEEDLAPLAGLYHLSLAKL